MPAAWVTKALENAADCKGNQVLVIARQAGAAPVLMSNVQRQVLKLKGSRPACRRGSKRAGIIFIFVTGDPWVY